MFHFFSIFENISRALVLSFFHPWKYGKAYHFIFSKQALFENRFELSRKEIMFSLCDLCVLSEAGGEKVIEITASNPTAQVQNFPLF
jgi:hypothetical protein